MIQADDHLKSTMLKNRTCPTCEKPNSQSKLGVRSPTPGEDFDFDQLSKHWFGFFQTKPFFSYHRCENCSLLYNPQYFTDDQLSYLYSNMPDNTAGLSENLLRKTQRGYFDFLKKYSKLQGEFLELGPDIGLFTENCVKEGTFTKYWLFEPNVNVHSRLRSLAPEGQVSIHTDMLNLNVIPDNSISVAVMIHVVDHLVSPTETLENISRKLVKGGQFLAVTHDETSLLAKVLGSRWPAYCLQHPQLYSPKTMETTLNKAGLKVVANEYSANYFPMAYLLKHLLFALGLGSSKLPLQDKLWLPLKLGNFMTLAEKI